MSGTLIVSRRYPVFADVLRSLDGWRWLFVAKTVTAALLALLISLVADLDSPRTAMFSVYLVMQARSGLVFQKSYYRLLGTLVGGIVSVALIAGFAQSPELFFVGFALWVSLCTAGSFIYRNFQSYGFVLAGYTVCFVALPAIEAPTHVFDIAVTRLLEMFVGLFCAAVVSDLVFPRRMADEISRALARRFREFQALLSDAPARLRAGDSGKEAMLHLAGDALGLEAAHVNAGLESSDVRRERLRLKRLNHEFMLASSTLHAFHQALRRLQAEGNPAVTTALHALYETFSALFQNGNAEAAALLPRLHAWCSAFPVQLAASRTSLFDSLTDTQRLDFDTGAELLVRLADEFRAWCATQASMDGMPGASNGAPGASRSELRAAADRWHFSRRTDPLLVALSACRALAIMAVTGGFWMASGGVWGVGPIVNGVASGTIFATLPSPVRVVKHAMTGWALALPLGLVWNFLLLPLATDWVGLCLLLAPPLALIAWLNHSPKWGAIGMGMTISFMLHVSLDKSFSANLPEHLNACVADFLGFAIAGVFYTVIDANTGPWGRRRIVTALRQLMVEICLDKNFPHREILESASRDLVQRIATRGQLADDTDHWVFDWLLTVLEIGRAAIDLRTTLGSAAVDGGVPAVSIALQQLGRLFDDPSAPNRRKLIDTLEWAIGELEKESRTAPILFEGHLRHSMLLDLHSIRSAVSGTHSILDGKERRHG